MLSIKYIDRHSTTDGFSTYDAFIVVSSHLFSCLKLGSLIAVLKRGSHRVLVLEKINI